jgi:putative flippase GtrA
MTTSAPDYQRGAIAQRIHRFALRFGKYAPEVERFIKFAIIGTLSTLVDFAALNVLQATVLPPEGPNEAVRVLVATIISYLIGLANSFFFNRQWTYPDARTRSVWGQIGRFFTVYVLALGLRSVVIWVSYPLWGQVTRGLLADVTNTTVARIATNLATGSAIAITMLWNFFANRYWTFGDVRGVTEKD